MFMNDLKLKEQIKEFLKKRNNLADIDELLIDELVFNLLLLRDAKQAVEENGIIELGRFGKKMSTELYVYQKISLQVRELFINLGIPPRERMKLKLEAMEKQVDEFDTIFN